MANFMTAVKWMQEGKKVRREGTIYPFYYTHEVKKKFKEVGVCEFSGQDSYKPPFFEFEDIDATDWGIIKEEDNWNLAQFEKSFEGTHVQFDYIYVKDVKKFIKKIKEDIDAVYKKEHCLCRFHKDKFSKLIDQRVGE